MVVDFAEEDEVDESKAIMGKTKSRSETLL
jgi:hypothetical protein